jgi:hypothetical protein
MCYVCEQVVGTLRWSEGPRTNSLGWYLLPPGKIQLAENRFLHAGNGAENTKEKIHAVVLSAM